MTLLADTLPGLFGGDVDVSRGSITVFRDNGGGNLQVGFDGGTPGTLGTVGNGLNDRHNLHRRFRGLYRYHVDLLECQQGHLPEGRHVQTLQGHRQSSAGRRLHVRWQRAHRRFHRHLVTDPDGNATIVKWEWNFGDGSAPVTILRTDTVTNGNARACVCDRQ